MLAPQSPPWALVAEPGHQLVPGAGDVRRVPAGLGGAAGEAVAGDRGDDHVEGVAGLAAVGGRVAERADHLQHLDDRSRPAVGEDDRQRVGVRRHRVDEVDVEAVDLGDEVGDGVQPLLDPSHVVVLGPVADQLGDRLEPHPLGRVGDGLALGEAGRGEASAEVVDIGLREVDGERPHGRGGGGIGGHHISLEVGGTRLKPALSSKPPPVERK
jgi:hypothetical protein